MSTNQGLRIQASCAIIWGASEYGYEVEVETDDYEWYYGQVQKDHGLSFGEPLLFSTGCRSSEEGWQELERMLALLAKQALSGKPMTHEDKLQIYGGKDGKHRALLNEFFDWEKRVEEAKEKKVKTEGEAEPGIDASRKGESTR